jgi:hypothetical protein
LISTKPSGCSTTVPDILTPGICFANVINDRSVAYHTAAIRTHHENPYVVYQPIPLDAARPALVTYDVDRPKRGGVPWAGSVRGVAVPLVVPLVLPLVAVAWLVLRALAVRARFNEDRIPVDPWVAVEHGALDDPDGRVAEGVDARYDRMQATMVARLDALGWRRVDVYYDV